MPRLSREEIDDNFLELNNFRYYWRDSRDYPVENIGNNRIFMPVNVLYEWKNLNNKKEFSTILRVFVGSGPDDGMTDLDETGDVTVERFHLRFLIAFQHYNFDKTRKSLIITSSSLKMGGEYKVAISPTISAP